MIKVWALPFDSVYIEITDWSPDGKGSVHKKLVELKGDKDEE
jgi:hypothetical protein